VIGRRIGLAQKKLGYTGHEMAAALFISPSTFSDWKLGISAPGVANLFELCRLAGEPASFFIPTPFDPMSRAVDPADEILASANFPS
jgi:transcriptional regulator with XRE-family HTH domain